VSDDEPAPAPPVGDGDGDLDDGVETVAEEPETEPGHPLRATDAFPFLRKVIG
jgi:hypothetical protein